jgi:hypothetical protein
MVLRKFDNNLINQDVFCLNIKKELDDFINLSIPCIPNSSENLTDYSDRITDKTSAN